MLEGLATGWNGPTILNAVLAVVAVAGPAIGYILGRRREREEYVRSKDQEVLNGIMAVMPEEYMRDFIGNVRGAHRFSDEQIEKFEYFLEMLKWDSTIFRHRRLEGARDALRRRSECLYTFTLENFDTLEHGRSVVLAPNLNPDKTGGLGGPKERQYGELASQLDKHARATFEAYRDLVRAGKRYL